MPVYVYRNLETDEIFEIEQRMVDDALTVHPETGDPVKRIIQPVGIAFKGSGFYVNDSKSSKATSKPSNKADDSKTSSSEKTSKDAKSSDSGSSTKTESSSKKSEGGSKSSSSKAA